MRTILVDDEPWMLTQFRKECSSIRDIELVGHFISGEEALEFAKANRVDFALLDIQLPGMNGIELASELRKLYPGVIIVFVSAYQEYLKDFIDLKADYYVLKPYNKRDVEDVMERVRLLSARLDRRVTIRTFGEFEVFAEGEPVHIASRKARELLAVLVDRRGASVDSRTAFSILWEDKFYSDESASGYRHVVARLERALDAYGIGDILIRNGKDCALAADRVDCDLYRFLDGDAEAIRSFGNRYMDPYSWGEERLVTLIRMADEYRERSGAASGLGTEKR